MCILYTYELHCNICSTVITAKVSYHKCGDLRQLNSKFPDETSEKLGWGGCGKETEDVKRVEKKLGVACVGGCEAFPSRKAVQEGE